MPLQNESFRRLIAGLTEDFGPDVSKFLVDPACEDIALNDDGTLWIKRLGEEWMAVGTLDESTAYNIISAIAKLQGLEINHERPILETTIPLDGSRFEGILPPLVRRAVFSIRKRASRIYTLSDYVADEIMTPAQMVLLQAAIERRKTILISGATGSGKTTLVNACLAEMADSCAEDRLLLIEDTPELQSPAKNCQPLLATGKTSMTHLLRVAMRMRPTRIVVGEVRGPEALAMLKAFNTGHPGGITTVHANDSYAAETRLRSLLHEAGVRGPEARVLIYEALDLIVQISAPSRTAGRSVTEVRWIKEGMDGGRESQPHRVGAINGRAG